MLGLNALIKYFKYFDQGLIPFNCPLVRYPTAAEVFPYVHACHR